jgi:hypothetical protein
MKNPQGNPKGNPRGFFFYLDLGEVPIIFLINTGVQIRVFTCVPPSDCAKAGNAGDKSKDKSDHRLNLSKESGFPA